MENKVQDLTEMYLHAPEIVDTIRDFAYEILFDTNYTTAPKIVLQKEDETIIVNSISIADNMIILNLERICLESKKCSALLGHLGKVPKDLVGSRPSFYNVTLTD